MKLLQQYTEAKGMRDSTFQFLLAKVLEIEEIQETFTWNTLQITEAVREHLARYVPMPKDVNILGTFGVLKDANGVQFKVGAWVSEKALCGQLSESLWVFHFQGTDVTNVEALQVNREG
ncbi:MAG: hypothetical protein NDI77_10180 [Geobacteraceae bacterium]|nr:hypothetical protein [Geobacteraceae bacterium]